MLRECSPCTTRRGPASLDILTLTLTSLATKAQKVSSNCSKILLQRSSLTFC